METDYEYVPLSLVFGQTVTDAMKRAVRVKKTVKEKLNRFLTFVEDKLSNKVENNESVLNEQVETNNEELSDIVSKMMNQLKVQTKNNRVVLYTRALFDKVSRITDKKLNLRSKEVAEPAKTEKVNDIVPDTWDKLPVEETVKEPVTLEEPVSSELKVEAKVTKEDMELGLHNEEATALSTEEVAKEPVTLEPKVELAKGNDLEFSLPTLDAKLSTEEMPNEPTELKMPDLPGIGKEVHNFDFLKSWNSNQHLDSSNPELAKETDDFVPTQTSIMARVKRTRNELEDERVKNYSLQEKVQVLEGSNKEYKDKIGVLESFVKDVVKENGRLTSENNQLKVDKLKLEEKIDSVTSNSATELDRQSKLHAEEIAKLNDKIAFIEEQHTAEKERMNEDFARNREISDRKHSEAMRALYSTISEALGEAPQSYNSEEHIKAA